MAQPTALPVIDISRFRAPDTDRDAFLTELRSAAHDVGFSYVTGYGFPRSLQDEALAAGRRFFALPEERRLEIENLNSPQFRGYTRTGTEYTAGGADWREQIDIGPEREALDPGPDDPDYLRLVGPNQWPSALPELWDIVLRWQAEALRVSREVLRALAAALGQDASSALAPAAPAHARVRSSRRCVRPPAPVVGVDRDGVDGRRVSLDLGVHDGDDAAGPVDRDEFEVGDRSGRASTSPRSRKRRVQEAPPKSHTVRFVTMI